MSDSPNPAVQHPDPTPDPEPVIPPEDPPTDKDGPVGFGDTEDDDALDAEDNDD